MAQSQTRTITEIDLEQIPLASKQSYWLTMLEDGLGQAINVPLLIVKGHQAGPVLGITAAIHGNELNGIPIIQRLVADIDPQKLRGTIIAIPGLNPPAMAQHQRRYIDQQDLNRLFPGKKNGNRSQQFSYQIREKILTKLDYLIDLHTASFGRENSLYVRGDLQDEKLALMVTWLDADIILNSAGPSAGGKASGRTMRAEASLMGVSCLTIEYGNPQVYQEEMIQRGLKSMHNLLYGLKMVEGQPLSFAEAVRCSKSYWIYLDRGGLLEIPVQLKQKLAKGQLIAVLRNPFGEVVQEYFAPSDGIVIGRSTNPVNRSGGRIIHFGIFE